MIYMEIFDLKVLSEGPIYSNTKERMSHMHAADAVDAQDAPSSSVYEPALVPKGSTGRVGLWEKRVEGCTPSKVNTE